MTSTQPSVDSKYSENTMNWKSHMAFTTVLLMLVGHLCVRGEAKRAFELIVAPATLENPRNDHQLIFKMRDGRLLLAWSEYYLNRPSRITRTAYAGKGGNPILDSRRISARISEDEGRSWSGKFVLQIDRYPANLRGGGNLLRLPSDEILFFYGIMYSPKDMRIYMKRSLDECETWSEPVQISTRPGFHWINHDRVLRLSSGRILVPTWWSPFKGRGDHYETFCYYSDDEGKTWKEGAGKVDVAEPREIELTRSLNGAMEPSIVELKDGSLLMVLRTNLGKVYKAYSQDQGDTWSEAEPTRLDAPAAEHLLKRIAKTGDLLLVWNHTRPTINNSLPRTPLTSAISRDEGKTWTHFRDIETHVGYDCAYPAVTFSEDEALITYYYGNRADNPGWYSVKLKIVPISWFYRE